MSGIPAGGSVEIQVATNPRFTGIVTWGTYSASPAVIVGLNRAAAYYARARGISSGGVKEGWGDIISFATMEGSAPSYTPPSILVDPTLIVPPEYVMNFRAEPGVIAGFPASNLLRDDPNMVFACTAAAGNGIYFAVSHRPVDTIALLDTTAAEDLRVDIRGGHTLAEVQSSAGIILANQPFRASSGLGLRSGYHGLFRLAAPTVFPYWGVTINQGSARQGVLMARYLVVGRSRISKPMAHEDSETLLELGSIDRGRDGTADRVFGHRMRKVDFDLALLTETQYETEYADLWRKVGQNEPMLVVPNPKPGPFLHDRILFGTVSQSRRVRPFSTRFTQSLSVESLI